MSLDLIITIATISAICIDCLYGLLGALMNHEFSSSKMRQGLLHKVGELVILFIGYIIQWVTSAGIDLGQLGVIQADIPSYVIIGGYIFIMEVGSILELCVKYNPQLKESPLFRIFSHGKDN